MLWSELMIDSVFSLRGEGVLTIDAGEEIRTVRSIKDEFASSRLLADALVGRRSGTLVNLMRRDPGCTRRDGPAGPLEV